MPPSLPRFWQKVDACRQSCHSYQDLHARIVTDMTLFLVAVLAAVAVAYVVALARIVRRDGLGVRQPPRSHYAWWE
jgi:hypothetical protein